MTVEQVTKIVGVICVISSSSGMGIWLSNQWKEHLKQIETLRKMIFLLKGEILYANAPLEEAFLRVGERCTGSLGQLFTDVAKRIEEQKGEPFYLMWQEEIDKLDKQVPVSVRDKQELKLFGEHLGYLDSQMQERTILLYLEQLDLTITYLRENQKEKCRLYTSLGVMGGLFLSIVMY